jgi:DNA-binding NtrC family response regulator
LKARPVKDPVSIYIYQPVKGNITSGRRLPDQGIREQYNINGWIESMDEIKKLLIVDDEETLTFSLYQYFILAKQNYEVVTAGSGEEAWEKINRERFDLVITDIKMPGMNGIELLSQIKKHYPDLEVIVMTAFGSEDKKEEAMRSGATFYLEKPFEMKEIKQVVMDILK